ncbi:hypothetical protein CP061683_0882C, partial [Chlamydia psittaci 06-1683]
PISRSGSSYNSKKPYSYT